VPPVFLYVARFERWVRAHVRKRTTAAHETTVTPQTVTTE